jgi:hypothetical protein
MNITSIEELQTLVDNGFRVLFLKDEDKEGEQFNEPGPYRIIVFKFPRLKDQADEVRASGATMELATKDINDNLKDVDDLREFIGLANSMDASVIIGDPSKAVN